MRWLILLSALTVGVSAASAVPVTVGHSTLAIPCGAPVQADWYKPASTATGLVWVQHGNASSKQDVAAFAQDFAGRTGALVVAPTVTSDQSNPCWLGSSAFAQAVASMFTGSRSVLAASAAAAGWTRPLPQTFVLMGHSLGGHLAVTAAARLASTADLRAVILLDGGSFDNGAAATAALTGLAGIPVLTISAPPGVPCKVGDLAPGLVAARPGQFVGVQLVNGLHLDTIGYSNFLGNLICGFGRLENIAAVQTLASSWTSSALTGTAFSYTGAPGQQIPVGAATAVAL